MSSSKTFLTLEELKLVKNIIEVSQARGAFRAEEMLPVGNFFAKVSKLVSGDDDAQLPAPSQQAPTGPSKIPKATLEK